jgi:hypothetical protein
VGAKRGIEGSKGILEGLQFGFQESENKDSIESENENTLEPKNKESLEPINTDTVIEESEPSEEPKNEDSKESKSKSSRKSKKENSEDSRSKRSYALKLSTIQKLHELKLFNYPGGTPLEEIVDEAICNLYKLKRGK